MMQYINKLVLSKQNYINTLVSATQYIGLLYKLSHFSYKVNLIVLFPLRNFLTKTGDINFKAYFFTKYILFYYD